MTIPARYAVDTVVTVRSGPPEPHCRTPHYLRGKTGRIVEALGCFRDPALMAFHRPGLPMRRLYRIAFEQAELWPEYRHPGDKLLADLYEDWLEAADAPAQPRGIGSHA